jgi:hypothetical protein
VLFSRLTDPAPTKEMNAGRVAEPPFGPVVASRSLNVSSTVRKSNLAVKSIQDAGGRELLVLACQQLDRAEALKAQIDQEGEVVQTRNGPRDHPALRHELQARAFVAKTLLRLGLNVEPLRPVPGRPAGWMPPDAR